MNPHGSTPTFKDHLRNEHTKRLALGSQWSVCPDGHSKLRKGSSRAYELRLTHSPHKAIRATVLSRPPSRVLHKPQTKTHPSFLCKRPPCLSCSFGIRSRLPIWQKMPRCTLRRHKLGAYPHRAISPSRSRSPASPRKGALALTLEANFL